MIIYFVRDFTSCKKMLIAQKIPCLKFLISLIFILIIYIEILETKEIIETKY